MALRGVDPPPRHGVGSTCCINLGDFYACKAELNIGFADALVLAGFGPVPGVYMPFTWASVWLDWGRGYRLVWGHVLKKGQNIIVHGPEGGRGEWACRQRSAGDLSMASKAAYVIHASRGDLPKLFEVPLPARVGQDGVELDMDLWSVMPVCPRGAPRWLCPPVLGLEPGEAKPGWIGVLEPVGVVTRGFKAPPYQGLSMGRRVAYRLLFTPTARLEEALEVVKKARDVLAIGPYGRRRGG